MSAKRTPMSVKCQLKAHADLERAKLAVQFAKTPEARKRAMSEVDRLRAELGIR